MTKHLAEADKTKAASLFSPRRPATEPAGNAKAEAICGEVDREEVAVATPYGGIAAKGEKSSKRLIKALERTALVVAGGFAAVMGAAAVIVLGKRDKNND